MSLLRTHLGLFAVAAAIVAILPLQAAPGAPTSKPKTATAKTSSQPIAVTCELQAPLEYPDYFDHVHIVNRGDTVIAAGRTVTWSTPDGSTSGQLTLLEPLHPGQTAYDAEVSPPAASRHCRASLP
jgi:hypothetical protein